MKQTEIEKIIEAESLKEFPPDVDIVDIDEAGFEKLRDANKDDREVFADGMRKMAEALSSRGIGFEEMEKIKELLSDSDDMVSDLSNRIPDNDRLERKIYALQAKNREALKAPKR